MKEALATPAHLAIAASRGIWRAAPHLLHLADLVADVAYSPVPRFLVVSIPPRHGKSWLISRYTPPWFLGMFPDKRVILVSAESDFAAKWGREGRTIMEEFGPQLFGLRVRPDSAAAHRWDIAGHEGGMNALGVGNLITGKGGDLIIIDDPVKGWEQGMSELERKKLWEWYLGTLRDRLEPGGSIILVMQRWHEEDLAGMVLAGSDDEHADQWEEVRFPAIAEPRMDELPVDLTTWTDRLGRRAGMALWPARYTIEMLRQIEATQGPIFFDSKFQQRPSNPEGDTFKVHDWRYVGAMPWSANLVRRVDLAATEKKQGNDPDWTAAVLMGRDEHGRTIIGDARRIRAGSKEVQDWLREMARWDQQMAGRKVPIHIEQEPGSTGKSYFEHLQTNVLPDYPVSGGRPSTGDKYTRSLPYASQQQANNVFLVTAEWNADFVEEHRTFGPMGKGKHDDWVDAASLAYLDLAGGILEQSTYTKARPRSRR